MSNCKQLTYEQRCQIYVLKKTKMTQEGIANLVGVSQATISRELRRNSGGKGYRSSQAQHKAQNRRAQGVKATKMTPPMIAIVESKLREKLSPEQVSGWLLEEKEELLSHETIYQHIW